MQVVENGLEIWKLEKYMYRWTMNLKTRQLPCEVRQSRCTWDILVESGTIDELGKYPGLHEQREFHNASLRKCGDAIVRIEVGPTPALRNLGEVGGSWGQLPWGNGTMDGLKNVWWVNSKKYRLT